MNPTLLMVPGFWVGTEPFENVSSLLAKKGFSTVFAPLASTGTTSPGNPSMRDDIAAIRSSVEALVTAEKDVVMILHSAGGFLGSTAIEGLIAKQRAQEGLKGGVLGIVFLSGAIYPEGYEHQLPPSAELHDGVMGCVNARNTLFGDLDDALAGEWMGKLKPQPASGWDDTVTYCGWKDVPSFYLVGESDQAIPPPVQEQLAGMAGSKVEKCAAGHMVMLGMPDKVVEIVEEAVASFQ